MPRLLFAAAAILALTASTRPASALTLLTTGKQAVFQHDGARIRIGRDPRLLPLADPTCAGGAVVRVQVAFYPQATARLVARDEVALPCGGWRKAGQGFVYRDAAGAAGGVTKVAYAKKQLLVKLGGAGYQPIAGPVGYAELWVTVGATRFLARFHDFARNEADRLVTRKPSKPAAEGEAAFWDVLLGDDKSAQHQDAAIALLERATKRGRKDGRSPFLLGMMHLYRYGLRLDAQGRPTDAARTEADLAVAAFDVAEPRLWDGTGDSRVPGFVAAAGFNRAFAYGDDAGMDAAVAALQAAVDLNAFFNVFDLTTVLLALPRSDPRWQQAFDEVATYLNDPDTLACLETQPEICSNAGFAPHNTGGSLLLFGDLYAKHGDATTAKTWYTLATLVGGSADSPWPFQALAAERLADVDARVARYLDADPENDDPVVGVGEQNCAVCHNR